MPGQGIGIRAPQETFFHQRDPTRANSGSPCPIHRNPPYPVRPPQNPSPSRILPPHTPHHRSRRSSSVSHRDRCHDPRHRLFQEPGRYPGEAHEPGRRGPAPHPARVRGRDVDGNLRLLGSVTRDDPGRHERSSSMKKILVWLPLPRTRQGLLCRTLYDTRQLNHSKSN